MKYQTTEFDHDDLFEWFSIQYTIDNDVVVAARITWDANYETFQTFENEILVQEYTGGEGTFAARGYEYRFDQFDSDGVITSRSTGYPDDLGLSENYVGGLRSEVRITDWSLGDGVQPWKNIVLTYDETGSEIVSRTTTYDDGTVLTDSFGEFAGLRQETQVDLDQSKNWLTRDFHYDQTGILEYRRIDYDNGIVRQDFYENGQRIGTAQTDNAYSNGDGIKPWTYIASEFDADGNLASRTIQYDNGVLKTETWEGGLRESFLQEDTANAKNWVTVTKEYDANGLISQQTITYDNGDVTINLYEDGARAQRLRLDGDDSASWLVQVTDYGPDGRTTTNYDSVEAMPADLFSHFPSLTPPPPPLTEMVLDFNDGLDILNGWTTLDGAFVVDVGLGEHGLQGRVFTNEYGGATEQDADVEAFNSWGATVGFEKSDGDVFDFSSVSLANASKSDTQYIPDYKWANQVTINGYNDGELVDQQIIDLTFDHVTHDVNMEGIDRLELVASGGGITNEYVENAGWFSMDDLVFLG